MQGLHRFYHGRSERVVASWMTRQDREAMIGDNIVYADCVVAALGSIEVPVVMAGFSQGVAMAFRAGVRGRRRAAAIIAVGGDVPPELLSDANLTFPAALIVRGEQDDWYTAVKLTADVSALASRGTPVETFVHPGGHEWTTDVSAAAASFIGRLRDEPI